MITSYLVDSLTSQDVSAKDATAIAKTVHAFLNLNTNARYNNYYNRPYRKVKIFTLILGFGSCVIFLKSIKLLYSNC